MAGSIGDAQGRITVDTSQAIGAINDLSGSIGKLDAAAGAGKGIGNFNQSTVGMAQGMQNVGRAAGALGVGIAAPFVAAGKAAIDFESQMAGVNAVMDLQGNQFQTLNDLALQLGRDTVFSATEAAAGIEALGKAGVQYEDIANGAAEASTNLAAAAETSVPRAAEIISAALNAYSLQGEDATQVADMLAGASNASLASLDDLGTGFGQVAGIASQLGVPMDELITQLAIMTDYGLSGSDAATSLKVALNSAVAPIGQAAEEQGKLGISFRDSAGEFIGLHESAELLIDTYDALGYSQAEVQGSLKALFGQDGYRALLFAMQEVEDERTGMTKGWDEYSRSVNDVGAAQRLAEERMDSTAGAIEQLRGSIETLSIIAGGTLSAAIRGPIEAATELVNVISNIPAPILGAAAAIGAAVGLITAAGGGIIVVAGYVLEGVARLAAAGVTMGAVGGAAVTLAANIALITIAILALKAAIDHNLFGLGDAIKAVSDEVGKIGEGITDGADAAARSASDMNGLSQAIYALGAGLTQSGIPAVKKFGQFLITNVSEGARQAGDLFEDLTKKGVSPLVAGLRAASKFADVFFGVGMDDKGIVDFFATAADKVELFSNALGIANANLNAAGYNKVASAIAAVGAGLYEAFGPSDLVDNIISIAEGVQVLDNAFWNAINSGLNPAASALHALSAAALYFGHTGLAESLQEAALAAQTFGKSFENNFGQSQIDGMNGISGALSAFKIAMQDAFGIDVSGVIDPAIAAIEAFTTATAAAAANGLSPLDQALAGVDALLDTFLPEDVQQRLDGLQQAIQNVATSVTGLLGAGLDRVGQLFGEIGAAISAGDFSGVATAFGSLAADIQAELSKVAEQIKSVDIKQLSVNILGFLVSSAQDIGDAIKSFFGFGGADPNGGGSFRGGTGGTVIDVPSLAVNILDFVVSAAKDIGSAIKDFFGFGGGTTGAQGADAARGGSPTSGTVIDIPSIAVNILDFLVSSAKDIGSAIKEFFGFGSGDPNGGGSFRGGTPAPIDIPSITVNILDFLVQSAKDIATSVQEWIGTGGGGNPNGGGSFRGGGGLAVTLDSVGVDILGFVSRNLPSVASLAAEITTYIATNLAGLVKTTIEDIAIALGIPDVTWDDFGAVISALNEPLKQIEVSGEFVAQAQATGAELGQKAGQALADAMFSAMSGGSGGGAKDTMYNANQGPPKLNFEDAMAAFTNAFVESFKAAAGPAIEKAGDEIQAYLKEKIGEMVRNIFSFDLLPSDVAGEAPGNSGQSLGGKLAESMGLGENGLVGAIRDYFESQAPDVEDAAREGAQTGISEPAEIGLNDTLDSLGNDLIEGAKTTVGDLTGSGLWQALFPKQGGSIVNGTDAAERIVGPDFADDYEGAIGDSMMDAVDGLATGGTIEAANAAAARIGEQAGQEAGRNFGESLATRFETDAGSQNGNLEQAGVQAIEAAAAAADAGSQYGVPADTFVGGAKTLVDKFGEALQTGAEGLRALAGGGGTMEAAGTGVITDADTQISSGIEAGSLPNTESSIGNKVNDAVTSGVSGIGAQGADAARGGAASAGSSIGSALDQVLATSIGGTTLQGFSQEIGVKIGEAITQGLSGASGAQGGRPGGAAGAADTSIGSSIANSLATSLEGADFSAVGTAIQAKISEALTAGLSAEGGSTAPAGGAGAGIGASIASSLATSIAGADFAMVGSAISAKISEAVASATSGGGAQGGRPGGSAGATGAGLGSSIAAAIASQVSGADFSAVGAAISSGIAGSMGTSLGPITEALGAVLQTVAAGAASQAQSAMQPVGSSIASGIASGVGPATGTIIAAIQAAVQAGVAAAQAIAATANTVGTSMTTAIGSGIGAGTGTVTSAVQAMVQAGIDGGTSTAAGASAIGEAIATNAGSGIGGATGTLISAVEAMVGAAIDAGIGAAAGASAIGAAISDGAAAGVIVTALNGVVAEMVRNGIAAGMEEAAAASPSKKMMELGGWMSEGAAIGVEQKAGMFSKSMQNMVKEGISAFDEIGSQADRLGQLGKTFAENVGGGEEIGNELSGIADSIRSQSTDAANAAGELINNLRKKIKEGRKALQKDSAATGSAASSAASSASSSGSGMSFSIDTKGLKTGAKEVISTLDGMTTDIARLRQLGQTYLQNVGGGEALGQELLDLADNIDSSRTDATDSASNLLGDITKFIKDFKKQMKAAAKDAGRGVGEGLSEGMADSSATASTATEATAADTAKSLNANLSRLPEMAEAIGTATGDALGTGVQDSLPAATDAGAALGTAFDAGLESTDKEVGNAAGDSVNIATGAMQSTVGNNTPVVEAAGSQLGEALNIGLEAAKSPEAAIQAVNSLHDSITQAVRGAVPGVQQDGQALGDAVGAGISQSNPTQTGKSLVDEATNGITQGAALGEKTASNAGGQIGGALEDGINASCSPVNKTATDLTDSCIPDGIESGADTAIDTAKDAGQDISSGLMKGLDIKKKDVNKTFDQAGKDFGSAIGQGIGSKQQDAVGKTNNVVDAAGRINGSGRATPVGSSIIDGIVKGIQNGTSKVTQAVDAAVEAGIKAAKKKADSNSPSKVFMAIGEDFMKGAAIGVDNAAHLLSEATERATDGSIDLFQGAGVAAATKQMDKALDDYTGRVAESIDDVGRVMERGIPLSMIRNMPALYDRREGQASAAQDDHEDVQPIQIGDVILNEGDNGYAQARQLVETMRAVAGQY